LNPNLPVNKRQLSKLKSYFNPYFSRLFCSPGKETLLHVKFGKERKFKSCCHTLLFRVTLQTQEEVEKILSENPSKEELKQKIREKLLGKGFCPNGDCPTRQKVVSLAELGKYLEEGWEFVTQLPENKVIIRFAESFA
jgi:hypothetical protein